MIEDLEKEFYEQVCAVDEMRASSKYTKEDIQKAEKELLRREEELELTYTIEEM